MACPTRQYLHIRGGLQVWRSVDRGFRSSAVQISHGWTASAGLADPTVLLIMGFTAQMKAWPLEMCEQIVGAGHHVVRFDNRDCGLSSKTAGDPPDVIKIVMAALAGLPVGEVPYSLSDMASDAVAVLDALGIE